jgi:outer membrane receptor protein involved in Fe transport
MPTATSPERSASVVDPPGWSACNSGSPIASFPARRRRRGRFDVPLSGLGYARQHAWIIHAGDTWRVNNKLTLDYGVRWDYYSPSSEKNDVMSFFDPEGANSGAGGRPGRLAFAGDSYGPASFGARYPEDDWYGGIAPRLGAVYQLNDKTVLRSGWGIFTTGRSIRAGVVASANSGSRTRRRSIPPLAA